MSGQTYPTHGIPTEYSGINFRSRLEATWARFFDMCGWRWEYEPADLDGYIPDFALISDQGASLVLVDVKPLLTPDSLLARANELRDIVCGHELLVVGSGLIRSAVLDGPAIGVLGQVSGPADELVFSTASLFTCRECGVRSFFHDDLSWRSRMCQDYDGRRYVGSFDEADEVWAKAKNGAQWKAVKPAQWLVTGTEGMPDA